MNFLMARGQEPAYFVLGAEQFRGIQIYDVIQDKQLNYWFATNEGLYRYDNYNYTSIDIPKARNNSVFGFVRDEVTGSIYCHNLSRQVFKIANGKCGVFYELRENEGSPDMSLAVADNGDLLVSAAAIVTLDRSGKVRERYNMNAHQPGPSYTNDKGQVILYQNGGDTILIYSQGKLTKRVTGMAEDEPRPEILKFFNVQNDLYAVDQNTGLYYVLEGLTLKATSKQVAVGAGKVIRAYETREGAWVAGSFPGVYLLRGKPSEAAPLYFEDHFISNVYQDNEGNILLSTFGEGVLVIPDMNIPSAIKPFADDPVRSVYADKAGGRLLLGTSKGKLLSYTNGKMDVLDASGSRSVEGIYGNEKDELVIYDNGGICALKGRKIIPGIANTSLKDAAVISGEEFYLATNLGVSRVSAKNGGFESQAIKALNSRAYFIASEPLSKNVYAYVSEGLFLIKSDGMVKRMRYKNEDIIANGLYCDNGKLYISTPEQGVLIAEGERVTAAIAPKVNGRMEEIKKLAIYNNTIIGQSRNGLFQFDMDGKMLRALHADNRFPEKKVVDLSRNGEVLWVCHSGGVQAVDLSYQQKAGAPPLIRIDSLLVNDSYKDAGKEGSFKYNERKIEFVVSSPTLKARDNTVYEYRLKGYDDNWKTAGYEQNHILYNAIGAGNYTLEIKAVRQGVSSETLRYSFSVAAPLYQRWYFIVSCMAIFVLMVVVVYRWQLGIQKKRAKQVNELNASKLTAIRSQMNPHFIFNALNSIQDLILKGDVERSYSYITTFSDLIRRSLDYSGKELIDIEQEIKLLELYLSLEQLRFKKDLSYELETGGITDIQIPPMLIQPFVENALAHGLLHKEGAKKLRISFELRDALICRIEDNGIGRERAAEILKRQRAGHESFSGEATKRRFEILSTVYGGKFGYVYEDLPEGKGTAVILTIPVVPQY